MASIIVEANYVVATDSDGYVREFAIGKSVYNERNDTFTILETIDNGTLSIPFAEVGNWDDALAVPFTESTLRTFLRVNTGFSPASGGSGASPLGFLYTKTGQTISYATYDDGDLQAGRGLDFFSLSVDNPHGNRERFTDELGTQVYANNIIIDWTTYDNKTAMGIHRTPTPNANWATQLTYCTGLTVGTFSTWRMANIREVLTFMNFSLIGGGIFGWAPFNNSGILIMSSTTYLYAANFYYGSGSGSVATVGKTFAGGTIPVRTFNKAELGL